MGRAVAFRGTRRIVCWSRLDTHGNHPATEAREAFLTVTQQTSLARLRSAFVASFFAGDRFADEGLLEAKILSSVLCNRTFDSQTEGGQVFAERVHCGK